MMSRTTLLSKTTATIVSLTAMCGLAATTGCSSSHKATQHQQAVARWNGARAGVLAGLARDQYNTGNFDKCRQTLAEALKLDPKNAELHVLSAKLAIEQNELEVAASELNTAQNLAPQNPEPDYLLGCVYQRWQQPRKAYDFYTAAAGKNPSELAYLLAQAEMLVAMDRQTDALNLLDDKVAYFEHSAVIRDAVGQLLVAQKRYPQAVDMLRQASVLETDDAGIREHLGMAMFLNQQYRDASQILSRLTSDEKFAKRGDLFLALGECQMQTNKPTDARASFETATELMPASQEAWLSLSKAAVAAGDIRRADLSLKRALALDPDNAEGNLMLGYVRLKQNRVDDAFKALTKASSVENPDALTFCMLGYISQKTGKNDQAVAYYQKALRVKPGDELASKLLASVDTSGE